MVNSNELMRGNWLFFRNQANVFAFRVENVTKRKVGYHTKPGESRMHYLRLNEEVQPIPLDARQLEKNGFEKVEQPGCDNPYHWRLAVYEDDIMVPSMLLYSIVAYETPFRGMYVNIFNPSDCEPIKFTKQIEHLHELQNTLRLCGIEREIIAF